MQTLVVVVLQIFLECTIDGTNVSGYFVEALFLQRSVEPFDMCIVVGFANPRVAVRLFDLRHKPPPKLRSMVALEHTELER